MKPYFKDRPLPCPECGSFDIGIMCDGTGRAKCNACEHKSRQHPKLLRDASGRRAGAYQRIVRAWNREAVAALLDAYDVDV